MHRTVTCHEFLALALALSPLVAAQQQRVADLDPWLTQLESASCAQRARAARVLGKLGNRRAVEPLIAALADEDYQVRRAAVRSLAKLRDPRAVVPLIALLEDKEHEVRQEAVFAVGELGDRRAVGPLLAALSHSSLRLAIVQVLGNLGGKRAVVSLLRTLDAPDGTVRLYAARALAKLGWQPRDQVERASYLAALREWDELVELGSHAVGPLVRALQQTDAVARRAAAKALQRLEGWKPGDKREQIYHLIALGRWEELSKLGPDVIEPLLRTVPMYPSGPMPVSPLAPIGLQEKVLEVVADIGAPAMGRLVTLLGHEDGDIAGAAAALLGKLNDGNAVRPLVTALEDRRNVVRMRVVEALGELRDARAVDPLLRRLGDEDAWVRLATAEVLEKLGNAGAVDALTAALKDSDRRVRFAAARALSRLGDRSVAPLIAILQTEEDPRLRGEAASELAKLGKVQVVAPLVAALGDKHGFVREKAARGLDKLGWKPATQRERASYLVARCRNVDMLGAVALPALLIALEDESDEDVRAYAINALMRMGPAAAPAIPALEKALEGEGRALRELAMMALAVLRKGGFEAIHEREKADRIVRLLAELSDARAFKRRSAAYALGPLGDTRAVEPLLATLTDRELGVRQAAADALGKLKDPRAFEALVAALRDERPVRGTAIEALGKLGDPRAVDPLVPVLKDKDWSLRSLAAKALGELKDPRALEPLVAALEDWRVQAAATAALGQLGDKRAIEPILAAVRKPRFHGTWEVGKALARIGPASLPPLLGLLADKKPNLRWLAAKALGELGDKRAVDPLSAALRDPSSSVRSGAAQALRRLGWEPQSELDRAYLLVAEQRWDRARELGRVAIAPLLLASRDERPEVRRKASQALAYIVDKQ